MTDAKEPRSEAKPETPSLGAGAFILHNAAMAELNKIGEALKLVQNIPTVSISTLTVNINITPYSGKVTLPVNLKEEEPPHKSTTDNPSQGGQ